MRGSARKGERITAWGERPKKGLGKVESLELWYFGCFIAYVSVLVSRLPWGISFHSLCLIVRE